MEHCQCPTCKLNGLQGRPFIQYSGRHYCTAHPQYLSIKRYKQALTALGLNDAGPMHWHTVQPVVAKPTVVTPPPKLKPVLHTYVLSFRDRRGVEQDWFIKSDCDEDASNQAVSFLHSLPFVVLEYTFIRETEVRLIHLMTR